MGRARDATANRRRQPVTRLALDDDPQAARLAEGLPEAQSLAPALTIARDGKTRRGERPLAAEVPVSITYNGLAHAVMMASPLDLEDFVTGFSLSEEIVASAGEIESLEIRALDAGLLAQATIPRERARRLIDNRRNLVGQTGCGLCGIVELDAALRAYAPLTGAPAVAARAVFAARDALAERQPLNQATGAVHAAAFCTPDGTIAALREDVGRHNALDKLIGHLARAGLSPSEGFVVMTSRLSFELAQKCLAARISVLAGVSAPTALAAQLAGDHNLTLIGLARADSLQVFCDPFGLFGSAAT